jgi:hypothetical protein
MKSTRGDKNMLNLDVESDDDDTTLEACDTSLFSESQNSSAVFSFSDKEMLVSAEDGSPTPNVISTSQNLMEVEDGCCHDDNQSPQTRSVRYTMLYSMVRAMRIVYRRACNVYNLFWAFVKRTSVNVLTLFFPV